MGAHLREDLSWTVNTAARAKKTKTVLLVRWGELQPQPPSSHLLQWHRRELPDQQHHRVVGAALPLPCLSPITFLYPALARPTHPCIMLYIIRGLCYFTPG